MQFVEGWALELLRISQLFGPRPMYIGGDHEVSLWLQASTRTVLGAFGTLDGTVGGFADNCLQPQPAVFLSSTLW